jgi:GNAT superfamily N-acetyltransferase
MAKKSFSFKAKHKSKKGGLTEAGRKAHNRATGSNLKRPQPEGGSRKKSYCARSKGQMNDHNIDCSKTPDKRICLARRRWKCNKSLQKSDATPKAKLAAFLREHLDNKLALKAAEPTITKSNMLPGGKGDTKDISDFDAKEVEMGMKVELEHTKDINVAKEIVADHLSEDPAYYSKLKGSGLADELEKGLKGDWEKEGYTISHKKSPHGGIYVQAHDKHGKLAGFASIGYHDWDNAEDSEGVPVFSKTPTDHIMSFETEVEPAHQRKGLASAMYQYAEQYYGVPMEMGSLSDDAAKLWKQPRRPFGKSTLEKAGRCWEGYEPTPGKKPYSKGSCRKIKKSELNKSDVSLHHINHFEGSPTSPTEHHYSVKHKGQEVGRAIVFDKDPKSIHNAGKIGPSLKDIRIKPEHQGKGLSGQIINKLVETHGPLASDSRGNISEAGVKMFNKYGTKQLDNSYVLSGGKMQKSNHQKLIKALKCKCQEKELKKSISAMAIESGEYKGETLDSHHHNRIGQEYRGMAKQAHTEGNKSKAREYHEKALMHFRKADEMGFQQEEPLEKKISGKLAAAGLGLTSAVAGLASISSKTSEQAAKPLTVDAAQTPAQTTPPIDISKFPEVEPSQAHQVISAIESSGGKNIFHRFLPKQGQRAVSQYGLLPTRVIELYARSPEFRDSLQGQMVGKIVDEHLSKFKTGNFYDTAAFLKNTPMHIKQNLFNQINEITKQKEHDDAIFHADRQHSMKKLSSVTDDSAELDIMATHSHHWHWPRTKRLYEKGGINAIINDTKSKEGNYIKKYHKHLPEGSPIRQKIEQFLSIPKKLIKPKKDEPFHGS